MKDAAALLVCLTILSNPLSADSWAPPTEKDYYSQNKNYVAHITPAKDNTKAVLEVSRIKGDEKTPQWQCSLGNEGAPQYVFLTSDGQYVATVNENSSRVHGGMGDYVIAFYTKTGLVKNYSLEQILHYTGPPNRLGISDLAHLVSRSTSGRSWATMPMFFDRKGDKLFFCVWLYRGKYWLAWDPTTGDEAKTTDDLKERWNNIGRKWAINEGINSHSYGIAVEFLTHLKNPQDRKLIEALVTAEDRFYTQPIHDWSSEGKRFVRFDSTSAKRSAAERALALWDGKPLTEKDGSQKYNYLATVSGSLSLPQPPQPDASCLCLYLIPGDKIPDDWCAKVPIHRLTAYFWKYSFHGCQWPGADIPFRIQGVAPGTYTIKAVWDKAKPYTFGDDYIKGPPQPGDCESRTAPTITVKPAQILENIKIDCAEKVANGPD